jgi:hypothetical protein
MRDDLLALCDYNYEKYEQFLLTGFIAGDDQTGYYLDDRVIDFIEKFLEIEEDIHPEYLELFFNNIKQNISYYETERNPRSKETYFYQVQRDLRSTGKTAIRHTAILNQKVQLVFETETNFELKQKKLEDIRIKRNQIESLIKKVENLLETELFFKGAESGRLAETIILLKNDLNSATKYLIEVQQHIIEYINRSKHLSLVFEKLQVLKRLKDRHELRQKSTIDKVLKQIDHLCFISQKQKSLWLFPENFEKPVYQESLIKINQKLHHKSLSEPIKAPPIDEAYFNEETEETTMLKLNELKLAFQSQNQDLLNFIIAHPFLETRDEKYKDLNQKIGLYCKIASHFEDDFVFTESLNTFSNYEYAIIKPRLNE